MATLLDISASVPEHRLRVFREYITRFQDEAGKSEKAAVIRCTIELLKALKGQTTTARKKVKQSVFKKYDGPGPHYITPKSGYYKGYPLHRYTKAGFKRGNPHTFIYAAESKKDAWQRHGDIRRYGLAKASWSWFVKSLFNRSSATEGNPRLVIDGRMVEGGLKEIVTGPNRRVEVLIVNKLDYITKALSPGALSTAVSKANDSLLFLLNRDIEKAKAKAEAANQ